MKRLTFLRILMLCCFFAMNTAGSDARDGIVWQFKTAGMITASPLICDGKVYCGSDDAYLYCRNALTGEAVWSYFTGTPVLSTPVVSNGIVFFESGNSLYSLNAQTGDEVWKFDPGSDTLAGRIDPWDYHHASPVIDDTVVYYGCGNGVLYGIEIETGSAVLQYQTVGHSPIRSTPLVHHGIIYFGDWHSRLYALDIAVRDTLWTYETVVPTPKDGFGFGAVVTDFILYDNALYFGARNNTVRAVDVTTGKDKWSVYDPTYSWMPGYPVVCDSVLYIGGSDNHSLWALDANTGEKIWAYAAGQNIFTRPLVMDDRIIISSGLSGTPDTPNPFSKGYLHLIDRSTGKMKNKVTVKGNTFSSPVMESGIVYFGSNDSTLYAIDSAWLFRPIPGISFEQVAGISLGTITEDAVAGIAVINNGELSDTIKIEVTPSKPLPEGSIGLSGEYLTVPSGQSALLEVAIYPQAMEPGNYSLTVKFISGELDWLELTKKISFKIPVASEMTDNAGIDEYRLFPNPADDRLTVSGTKPCKGIEFYNMYGALVFKKPIGDDGCHVNVGFLNAGTYVIKLISPEGESFRKTILVIRH